MMFHHKRPSRVGSFVKGAVLGGLAIGATALLCAPSSGKKLRNDLKKRYKDAAKGVKATKKATRKLTKAIKKSS